MSEPPIEPFDYHEYGFGQRMFLGVAALVFPALFLLVAGIGKVVGVGDSGHLVAVGMLFIWVGLPYGQWLVALPLAIVLHTRGRTVAARGVLRGAAIVFLAFGLLYSTCCGLGGLVSGLVQDNYEDFGP